MNKLLIVLVLMLSSCSAISNRNFKNVSGSGIANVERVSNITKEQGEVVKEEIVETIKLEVNFDDFKKWQYERDAQLNLEREKRVPSRG